jgi:serine/threonine-protein kinase
VVEDGAQISPPDALVGAVLAGRYHIERKLGEGGMGSVYRARHTTLDKPLAIKVLHGELARKPDLVERFLQEARSASRIRHENVIDITDFGITDDRLVFFCMELLTGKDLHEIVTRAALSGAPLPWSRTGPIFLQVCSALAAAHAEGVIHRDLKPENIFLIDWLGNGDFVKLLDFGIAKEIEESEEGGRKLTRTGMLFGTPEYMSPEQARGEKPDTRVDVYAMGCILHQLIAGEVPFQADSFMAVLSRHLSEPPPVLAPEQLERVGAPAALAPVVLRALEKDRERRYGSIVELAEAVKSAGGLALESSGLYALARPETAEVAPVSGAGRPEPRRGRRGALLVALGAVGVAAAASLALVLGGGGDGEGAPVAEPAADAAAMAVDPVVDPEPARDVEPAPEIERSGDDEARPEPRVEPPTPRIEPPTPRVEAPKPEPPEAEGPKPEPPADDPTPGDVDTKNPFE